MGCKLEFSESQLQVEFCSQGSKQRILIDVLLKYSEMSINDLASALEVPVTRLHDIYNGRSFLIGEQADSLAQLFLVFFGRTFFKKFSIIRSFVD